MGREKGKAKVAYNALNPWQLEKPARRRDAMVRFRPASQDIVLFSIQPPGHVVAGATGPAWIRTAQTLIRSVRHPARRLPPHATLHNGNIIRHRPMHPSRGFAQHLPSSGTLRLHAAGVPSISTSTQSVFLTFLLHEPCAYVRAAQPRYDARRLTR